MDLSVIISTHNNARSLAGVFGALSHQDVDSSRFEIIVADNGSADATPSIVAACRKAFQNFAYLYDPRPGQLVGWHRGIALARGAVLTFIDDDVHPDPAWAASIIEAFEDPDTSLATGPIRPSFAEPPPNWQESFIQSHKLGQWSALWGTLDFGSSQAEISPAYVWGSNFIVRKQALLEAGGFHPGGMPSSLFHFTGDGEMALGQNIERLGGKIYYLPGASVTHHLRGERNSEEEIRRWMYGEGLATSYHYLREIQAQNIDTDGKDLVEIAAGSVTDSQINKIGSGYLTAEVPLPPEVGRHLETKGAEGFRHHQELFAADVKFRQWVLQESYLDIDACYDHTDLMKTAAENQSQRSDFEADYIWSL